MRITREILIRTARETAQKRAFSQPDLVAAYLTGSLRTDNPFLGGATDIDIIFVHPNTPKIRREVVAVTPEVHLDILHTPRSDYDKPRSLRLDPWRGPELYDPLPLLVTGHFFEFVQAGVRDKFNDPESILTRARTAARHAREIWSGLQTAPEAGAALLLGYLKGVSHAANAVSLSVNGNPLAERRFLLQFPARAEAAGKPGLTASLMSLLGADGLEVEALRACLGAWETDYRKAAGRPKADARIALPRLAYYKLALHSMLESESPYTILWPLLLTWTLAARALPAAGQVTWETTCKGLGLQGAGFDEKLAGLDKFLDEIEEMLEHEPA